MPTWSEPPLKALWTASTISQTLSMPLTASLVNRPSSSMLSCARSPPIWSHCVPNAANLALENVAQKTINYLPNLVKKCASHHTETSRRINPKCALSSCHSSLSNSLSILLAFVLLPFTRALAEDNGIKWQPWSDSVFAQAKREGRFVLLDLGTVWCHVMEEVTYRDPAVIDLVGRRYLAVRVDADARPDLSNRYEDYGWPATIVFNNDGSEIVKRRGYLPPGQMASWPLTRTLWSFSAAFRPKFSSTILADFPLCSVCDRQLLSSSADDANCVDPADRTPCNAGTSAAQNTSSANSRV